MVRFWCWTLNCCIASCNAKLGSMTHSPVLTRMIEGAERLQLPLYLFAIATGAVVGYLVAGAQRLEVLLTPALGLLLYSTFLGIPLGRLRLPEPKFLGSLLLLNFVLIPLLVYVLSRFVPDDPGLQLGLLLVLLCPCIDYVIVFAALAGAREEKLLALTPLLMGLQLLLLPGYLYLMAGKNLASIDAQPFLEALLGLILLPLGAAALTQRAARRKAAGRRMLRVGGAVMVPAMLVVLFVVVASQTPRVLASDGRLWALVPLYLGFLILALGCGLLMVRLFKLEPRSARAVVFSGATRNSLVVLPLALALPAGAELAPAAVVTQTLMELIGMVLFVWLIPKLLPVRN